MKNALNTLRDRFGKDGLAGILLEVAAVMLLVAAFIVPPRGVIDRMMNFDDYMADSQVRELREEYYKGSDRKIKF